MYDIISIGDCKADRYIRLDGRLVKKVSGNDFVVLPLGSKIVVPTFTFFAGGNALNAAATFTRLGMNAAIIASLGDDDEGEKIIRHMRQKGIVTRFIHRYSGESDRSIVLVARGERSILSYTAPKKYVLPAQISTRWAYVTSLSEDFARVYHAASRWARAGVRIAFNPGTRQLLDDTPAVRSFVRFVEVVVVNREEAARLTGAGISDVKKLLGGLIRLGAKIAVVTDGPKGAYAQDSSGAFRIGSFPMKRVDSTGAGDAFASTFVAALHQSKTIVEALRWASVNAAHEVNQIGVQNGLLEYSKIISILKNRPGFKPSKI